MGMRAWLVGGTLAALAALAFLAGPSRAGDDEKAQQKKILEFAAAIKTDKDAGLKKAADMGKKVDSIEGIMHGFKPRKRGGFGVGDTPGAITPDGIELYINGLARDGITATALGKQAKAIEDLSYISAAVAEVTHSFNNKDFGKKGKTKKEWQELAERMRDGSLKLAAAAKAKGAAEIKTAAKLVNDACNACHSKFRE
ncbi:MAG: cytochrome c [Gemmataceae bacterium]